MIYAWLLRTNGVPRHEAAVAVNLMGSECHPRLTPSECRGAIKTGFGRRMSRMLDQTISDRLDVTPAEAALLERLPPAMRFVLSASGQMAPSKSATEVRARTIMERRARIIEIVQELGTVPTVREMARRLEDSGIQTSRQTVSRDCRALQIAK